MHLIDDLIDNYEFVEGEMADLIKSGRDADQERLERVDRKLRFTFDRLIGAELHLQYERIIRIEYLLKRLMRDHEEGSMETAIAKAIMLDVTSFAHNGMAVSRTLNNNTRPADTRAAEHTN